MSDTPDAPRPVTLEAMLRDRFERVDHERQDFAATRAALTARWLSDRGVRVVPPGAVVVPRAEAEFVADFICAQRCGYGPKAHSKACETWRAALRAWPKGA